MLYLNNTEKRLIVLYILSHLKTTVTQEKLSQITVKATPVTWIDTQLTIQSLIKDQLISESENRLEITSKGEEVIQSYYNQIPETIREDLNNYISNNLNDLIYDNAILANLKKKDDIYEVYLSLREIDYPIIEIKLSVPDKRNAEKICLNWEENASVIFRDIISILTNH